MKQYLSLITLFILISSTGCSLYSPLLPKDTSLHTNHYDNERLLILGIESNLLLAKWFVSEYKYHEEKVEQFKNNIDYSKALKKNQYQQQKVAAKLLQHCNNLNIEKHRLLIDQCSSVLSTMLMNKHESTLLNRLNAKRNAHQANSNQGMGMGTGTQTGYKIDHTAPKLTAQLIGSSQMDTILDSLEQSVKSGDLLTAKVIFQTLFSRSALTPTQQTRKNHQLALYNKKTQSLDEYADQLYQKKAIAEAQAIWALLLKLDNSPEIQNKYNRAKKVLENLRELRQDGHTLNPASKTQSLPTTKNE